MQDRLISRLPMKKLWAIVALSAVACGRTNLQRKHEEPS